MKLTEGNREREKEMKILNFSKHKSINILNNGK